MQGTNSLLLSLYSLPDDDRADRSCDGAADAEAGVKGALETSEEEALLTPLDFLTHSASQCETACTTHKSS